VGENGYSTAADSKCAYSWAESEWSEFLDWETCYYHICCSITGNLPFFPENTSYKSSRWNGYGTSNSGPGKFQHDFTHPSLVSYSWSSSFLDQRLLKITTTTLIRLWRLTILNFFRSIGLLDFLENNSAIDFCFPNNLKHQTRLSTSARVISTAPIESCQTATGWLIALTVSL
jgi:hypothetical protein